MEKGVSIVLTGEAGQGLQTVEALLLKSAVSSYYVFSTREYMSRVRGGNNSVAVRIATGPVQAYNDTIDVLVVLQKSGFNRFKSRLSKNAVILGDKNELPSEPENNFNIIPLPLLSLASKAGNIVSQNVVIFGVLSSLLDLDSSECIKHLRDSFSQKGSSYVDINLVAYDSGYLAGQQLDLKLNVKKTSHNEKYIVKNGTEAAAIGALAGGCDFIAAYPVFPAIGVYQYLASHADDFGIVVEQAEDEIAACNMVIGAWYAGGRGFTTTSGAGLSLMAEAIGLSAMTETPCVIHVGQLPGPATGLPTRTEQSDLLQAVYTGHSEFSRIVLSPGTVEETMLLTQKSFYLADKYQIPVIILTDQFLLDSFFMMKPVSFDESYLDRNIIESDTAYKRYAYHEDPVSPRSVPGYGEGTVRCNSQEHDEEGLITEDFSIRSQNNSRRLHKEQIILDESENGTLYGNPDFTNLIIGWGSTFGVISEALENINRTDTSFFHITQPYPLSDSVTDLCGRADKIICVENNASGQMARLLQSCLGIIIKHRILQYNGLPYSVESLTEQLLEVL